ncbi:hypothetical protein C8F01DRAFT_1092090 [Mycena amicta]|nr:hypothetical protein C8F01DRAFT_1092090 [Mycena amicta]
MSRTTKSVRFALAQPPVDTEPIYVPDSDDDDDTKLYADFEALAIEAPSSAASRGPPPIPVHSRPHNPPSAVPPAPAPAPAPAVPSSQSSTAMYLFPTSTGVTRSSNWAQAAAEVKAAAGVATAIRKNKQKKKKPVAYMVACGRRVCVSESWDEVKQLTNGFSHNLFEGYPSREAAQAALDWLRTRRLTSSSETWSPREEDIPRPCTNPDDLASHGPRDPSDAWHIVYVGINPGVFPTSAEAAVNVLGVKGGLRDHRDTHDLIRVAANEPLDALQLTSFLLMNVSGDQGLDAMFLAPILTASSSLGLSRQLAPDGVGERAEHLRAMRTRAFSRKSSAWLGRCAAAARRRAGEVFAEGWERSVAMEVNLLNRKDFPLSPPSDNFQH